MKSTLEINVSDYLSEDEIKEIAQDQVRAEIRRHFEDEREATRILSNVSYGVMYEEIDKIIPDSRELVKSKVVELLNKSSKEYEFKVFRDGSYGSKPSIAHTYIQEAVRENKDIFKDKIKKVMMDRDLTQEVWDLFYSLAEDFTQNIYKLVDMVTEQKENK